MGMFITDVGTVIIQNHGTSSVADLVQVLLHTCLSSNPSFSHVILSARPSLTPYLKLQPFNLYRFLVNVGSSIVIEKRTVMAWGQIGEAGGGRDRLQRDRRKLGRVMDMVIILIVVVVSRVYIYVKIYQIVHFKYVYCVLYFMSIIPLKSSKNT